MVSRVTGRRYDDVNVVFVDALTHMVCDLAGNEYRELGDGTWIAAGVTAEGALRYSWTYAHAGGVVLKPLGQLIGGTWIDLVTGARMPEPRERAWA